MFNFLSGGRARTSNRIRAQRARNATTKRHLHLENLEARTLLATTIVNSPAPVVPHPSTLGSATISGTVEDDCLGTGIGNFEVDLMQSNSNGPPVAVVNTNPDGTFTFTNVKPGVYELQVNTPGGFAQDKVAADSIGTFSLNGGTPNAKWGGKISQIGTTSTDLTYIVVSPTGTETYSGILFSFVDNGSVQGTVYNDKNDNETLDTNIDPNGESEPGIKNAEVTLSGKDLNGHYVKQTLLTDGLGNFDFSVAPSGPAGYTLKVTTPGGFLISGTKATVGGDDTIPVDGVSNQFGTAISSILVKCNVEETGFNFAFIKPDSIQGFVLNDIPEQGVVIPPAETPPGGDQPGIGGITVRLTGTDDLGHTVFATTFTDPDGSYAFEGLRPGVYKVSLLNIGPVWQAEASVPGIFEVGDTSPVIGQGGPLLSIIRNIDIRGITGTEGTGYDFLLVEA